VFLRAARRTANPGEEFYDCRTHPKKREEADESGWHADETDHLMFGDRAARLRVAWERALRRPLQFLSTTSD
jgi:hypothetical protein